jgi:hypothetical protein
MRALAALLLPLPLLACGPEALVVAPAAGAASLALTGRTPVDHLAGWATGLDCSGVRLERYGPWCVGPRQEAPAPRCSRSLGSVDCWMPATAAP